jgi:hypothetical protein
MLEKKVRVNVVGSNDEDPAEAEEMATPWLHELQGHQIVCTMPGSV